MHEQRSPAQVALTVLAAIAGDQVDEVLDLMSRGEGGGIYNRGTVTLTHTLVAHNTLNNCSPVASVPGCFG